MAEVANSMVKESQLVFSSSLMETGEMFRSLLNRHNGVVLFFDSDGNYIDCSEKNAELLYLPAERLVGKNVSDILPEHLAELAKKTIGKSLSESACVSAEYEIQIAGKRLWFEAISIPFTKNVVLWLARDITEKKQAEQIVLEAASRIDCMVGGG